MTAEVWRREEKREVCFTALVDRNTHEVDGRWGRFMGLRRIGISHVSFRFTWDEEANGWSGPRVTLVSGGGLNDPVLRGTDLNLWPAWLIELQERALRELSE